MSRKKSTTTHILIYQENFIPGKSVVWEQACSLLEKRFTNPGPRRTPTVLVVDEASIRLCYISY